MALQRKVYLIKRNLIFNWWCYSIWTYKKCTYFQGFPLCFSLKPSEKLPAALNKFNNNSAKQHYMNIEKSCHNFELCNATLETIKKTLAYLDASKVLGLNRISSKFLKDTAEALHNPVNFSIKQSLFPDQSKIANLKSLFKKALRMTRKITGPSYCCLLCLR